MTAIFSLLALGNAVMAGDVSPVAMACEEDRLGRECYTATWNSRSGLEASQPALRAQFEVAAGNGAQCRSIVDLSIGTASGNHSFGAVCEMPEGDQVMCFDEMVGHSARSDVSALSDEMLTETGRVAGFVYDNCWGG